MKKRRNKTYLDHLEELRFVLISIFIFFILSFIISFVFIDKIILFWQAPVNTLGIKLSYFKPEEKILTYLKVCFFVSVLFTLPFMLLRSGQFIFPALKKNERKYFLISLISFPFVFYGGCFFAYKIIFPFALKFFYNFAGVDTLNPVWGLSAYFDFLIIIVFGTGIVFLFPLPVFILIKLNIIDYNFIKKLRPYFIILILILAAIFSPPDIISQLLVAIPLYILFEISVLISKLLK